MQQSGLRLTIRASYWRLKTYLLKKKIGFQDRAGLFSYQQWQQENKVFQVGNDSHKTVIPEDRPKPLISFLIPISPITLKFLPDTLNSLLKQAYPHWEACIFPSGSEPCNIKTVLPQQVVQDPRIHDYIQETKSDVVSLFDGIVHSIRGDYVAYIKPGDTLSTNALTQLADYIRRFSLVEIIYFDEDYLSADGRRQLTPFLKPDWSPELLLSVNYLLHALFARELFASSAQKSQAYVEIIFRCVEGTPNVGHISGVLYHRRESAPEAEQPWYSDAEVHCHQVERYLQRIGILDAKTSLQKGNVQVHLPIEEKLVSIIIPSKDRASYLQRCVSSLLSLTHYKKFELIVMDNDSIEPATLEYYQYLKHLHQVSVVENKAPFNFSAYNNQGARRSNGELLLFLNNDIEIIDPDWLDELVQWAEQPEIGVVGAKLLYPDLTIQHAGIILGLEGHASHVFLGVKENSDTEALGPFGSTQWYRNYSAVTGACMMFRRQVFETIGGFNEDYNLVFSDIEICLRIIQAGYRVVYNPFARLIHHEGKTRASRIPAQDIRLGYEHFKEIIETGDPYFNPWLSTSVRIPTLKRKHEELPIRRLQHILEFTRD